MRKTNYVAVAVSTLLFGCAKAPETPGAALLSIEIDMSGSHRLIENPAFANVAAKRAYAEVARLRLGDRVVIRQFGARIIDNIQPIELEIDRRNHPKAAAQRVAHYFENLSAKAAEGQSETNIIAALEFGAKNFDCTNGKVLVFTDGIESSSYISARNLLAGKPLPAPEPGILKNCTIEMIGFGQSTEGLPPVAVKNMLTSWRQWMDVAGAKFTAIIDP